MTPKEFRDTCVSVGLQSVGQQSRGLGVSHRQVDRYRSGEQRVPKHVQKLLAALAQVQALKREVAEGEQAKREVVDLRFYLQKAEDRLKEAGLDVRKVD